MHTRHRGQVSEDGTRIDGAWVSLRDGEHWIRDLGLAYVKAAQTAG